MLTPVCSKCHRAIPESDINVAKDVAFCRACNTGYELSTLVSGVEVDPNVDLTRPPAGAWYTSTGLGAVMGATHRSIGMAMGALAVSLFWNGIVSVFVLIVTSGTLHLLKVPLPDWFPAPKMNGATMGVGMVIFMWLFLTPFIVIGLAMVGAFLSALAGRTEVFIHHSEGSVFTGIGPLGWRRRFNAEAIKDVRIANQKWRDSDGDRHKKTQVILETLDGRQIGLGAALSEERRKFLAAALRKTLFPQAR